MKKQLSGLFAAMILVVSGQQLSAQCTWQATGGAASTSTNTAYNDIALDASNGPYIAYCDGASSNLATVRTYTSGAWQQVGSTGSTNASYTSLAIDSYTPYLAYVDGSTGNKATVKKYSAGAWTTVGTAVSTGSTAYTSIAIDASGTPYVAYQDVANGNRPTVKTFTAGAWALLGGTTASTVSAAYTALALDHAGTPYIIYQDNTNSGKASVKKYSGGVWASVGSVNISTNTATYLSIDFDAANTPYIAYIESSSIATIKSFTAGAWQAVGTGTVANAYTYLNIAIEQGTGTPYLTYYQTGSYGAAASIYRNGTWAYAGNQPFSVSSTASGNAIAIEKISNNGPARVWTTYNDYGNGAYAKVLQTNTSISPQPASVSACAGSPATFSLGATSSGSIYYQWQVNPGSGNTNIAGATTGTYAIPSTSLSQSGYSYKCIVYDGCMTLYSLGAGLTVNPNPTVTVNSNTVCAGNSSTLTATGASTYYWTGPGQSTPSLGVTSFATSTFEVIGTSAAGCTAAAIATITVNSNPSVTASNYIICAGSSAVLLAGGANTYTWSTGATTSSITVVPATTTSYTVTGTDANGCTGFTVPTMTVNANPTVSVTNTTVCAGNTATLTATGNATGYYWNTGATSNTLAVSPGSTTAYTVTGTDANSCSTSASGIVTVNPNPTAAFGPVAPVCTGGTISLADNSTGSPIQWDWSGPNSFLSSAQNPSINGASPINSGIYNLVVKNSFGCSSTAQQSVTVYAQPSQPIITAFPGSICAGGTASLTASGLIVYSWSSGNSGSSILVSPTSTSIYTVTGADIHGCTNTQTASIAVISSKNISGAVTSTAGAVSGNVVLYKYSPTLSQWDSTAYVPFASGYTFTAVDSASYVVKAIPTATNMQISYGTSAISWQNATVITHGCTVAANQPIQVQAYISVPAGPGILAGNISAGNGYGHKGANIQGNPIPGVVVKGGKNPGGAIFGETVTDGAGNYSFSNLALNTGLDDYFILVDIPGLDTNHTYREVLTIGHNSYVTLDFIVDSMYVNPVDLTTSVNEINKADYLVKLFPNPARNYFNVQYSLLSQSEVTVELLDVTGKRVQALQPAVTQAPGDYSPAFQTGALSPGMYFVKLRINRNEATIKVFITD